MKRVWIGLGGNLGDVRAAMGLALRELNVHEEISHENVSSIYKTPPWGLKNQPWFLNACAELKTSLTPEHLLEVCQAAEHTGKRERTERWGPRTIDVDILVFEGVEQVEQRLTLPHPRMLERAFVLVPLAEICPSLMLDGISCENRAKAIDGEGIELVDNHQDWWK